MVHRVLECLRLVDPSDEQKCCLTSVSVTLKLALNHYVSLTYVHSLVDIELVATTQHESLKWLLYLKCYVFEG
jgi:hypothetical protein